MNKRRFTIYCIVLAAIAAMALALPTAMGATLTISGNVAPPATAEGDFIKFDNAKINGVFTLKSRQTLTGTVEFVTGNNEFAIVGNGVSDVTIQSLKVRAPCGVIRLDGSAQNVRVLGCDFQWGYNGSYYNRIAIRSLGSSTGLTIEGNTFRDSPASDRNVDIDNSTGCSYSFNTFKDINDGGHLDGRTRDFRFVGNRATGISRMGLELQDHGTTDTTRGDNILIAENVFTDWRRGYWDSFAVSIMPQRATRVVIRDNYFRCESPPRDGWKEPDSGGNFRYGYGIEAGFNTGAVTGNAIIGNWVSAAVSAIKNTPLKDNKAWGNHAWGTYSTEPGLAGMGSWNNLGGNTANVGPVPPVPPPTTQPTPPPTSQPTGTATAFMTYIRLTLGGVAPWTVERRAGDNIWAVVTLTPTTLPNVFEDRSFTSNQITSKWKFWYRINGGAEFGPAQIGIDPDPPVIPPPTVKDIIVTTETVIDGRTGAVKSTNATTRPVN